MNLTYLRAFYATIKCNSISKAATDLHLTQSGLSRQLKSLERELDEVLLYRSNKGVELTEAGKILYESAETMLSLENNIIKQLDVLKNKNNSLLILSCNSMGENILPCSIYTFKKIYYSIDIKMEVDNYTNILSRLLTHDSNLAIIQNINLPDTLNTIDILSDELILVSGNMSSPDCISLNELLKYPLILKDNTSGISKILDKNLSKVSIDIKDLNILFLLNSIESIKSTVIGNKTFSFLPQSAVRNELKRGLLKKITISDFKMTFNYCITYRKSHTLTTTEKKFIKFLSSKKTCFCY